MYTVLATVLIPLFLENRYFNVTKAKSDMFSVGIGITLLCAVFSFIADKSKTPVKISDNRLLILPLLLIITTLVSSAFSESFLRALSGADGWRVGLFAITALSAIFIYLSLEDVTSDLIRKVIPIVNMFIYGLVITDSMGIDVFGLHKGIIENQYYDYVSTIGNVNQMSGYLCLTLPFLLALFLWQEKSPWRTVTGITLVLGFFAIILCKSDSFYLGAGVCAFFAIPVLFKDKKLLGKTVLAGAAFCLVSMFIRFSGLFREKLEEIDGISLVVLSPKLSVPALALMLILFLILHRFEITESALKIMKNVVMVMMAVFVLVMVAVNIRDVGADYYHWGSGRGAIWYESYRLYTSEYSFLQKLFGAGPDVLGPWYANLSIGFGQRVLVSHSEPIQVIMSLGICGFAVYCSIVACTIKRVVRLNDLVHAQYCWPVIAYYGQSLLNSATLTNLSLFVLFMIHLYSIREKDDA